MKYHLKRQKKTHHNNNLILIIYIWKEENTKVRERYRSLYEQMFLTNQMTGCTPLIKDPLFKVSFGKETIKEV